jgi:myo-inositol-1(or 4)-monophosphatase
MKELSEAERRDLIAVAEAVADAGRREALAWFRREGLSADSKEAYRFDPVTEGDRAAERAMRAVIEARRPTDGILGEEYGPKPGTSGLTWIIDPIDGTRGFLSGTPTWGVLVGLRDGAGALLGVIDQPYIGERFLGGLAEARFDGPLGRRALRARSTARLSEAILFSTFPEIGTPTEGTAFRRVAEKTRLVRYGTDCYAYALLALGQIDLVIEAGLQAYDVVAPIAVIEAAGGIVTDWKGRPALEGGRILAAANAKLHAEALALLAAP